MKTLVALVIAATVALTRFGLETESSVARLPAGLTAPVRSLMARAMTDVAAPEVRPVTSKKLAKIGSLSAPKPALQPLDEPVEVVRGGRRVYIPRDCRTENGTYDVLVHFHGAPESVVPAFEKSGVQAILVMVNLGIGSGPYERGYGTDGALRTLLERVDAIVDEKCPSNGNEPDRTLDKVALSSWSAGYGAIIRILGNDDDSQLVDAVLLSDGLHVGFIDKAQRKINPLSMQGFDRFAEKAVKGEKLFAITHTAIKTPYASTTETAKYLIENHQLAVWKGEEQGPRDTMTLTQRAARGSFHVASFAGGDTHAHCDHLYAIGDTLWSKLADRWNQ